MKKQVTSIGFLVFWVAVVVVSLTAGAFGYFPPPSGPVAPTGTLTLSKQIVRTGTKVGLTWNIMLPKGANPADYRFTIRQSTGPENIPWDMVIVQSGTTLSFLPIDTGTTSFGLWAYRNSTNENWLLDSKVCTGHLPTATLTLVSEDPCPYLRTRADRPFSIEITTSGIETGDPWPVSSKGVKFTSHVQANYPPSGGETLVDESTISTNGTQTSTVLHSIPAVYPSKATGEQRLSIYTQE